MLNPRKLEHIIVAANLTRTSLCSKINIEPETLDSILNGGDEKVSIIEAIAKCLKVNIGCLFDEEENVDIRNAGRDYVEKGKIEHNGTEHNASDSIPNSELIKKNIELSHKLIASQEKVIELMGELAKYTK